MKTVKPISTISYNSTEYLKDVLEGLYNRGVIQFYAFVKHKAESDETKDHIHLYIEPADRIELNTLRNEFYEYDLSDVTKKPLGVQPFRLSKTFGDWYLYSVHDETYLASKGMSREFHYSFEDVESCDSDDLAEKVHTISLTLNNRLYTIISRADSGESWASILRSGIVPLNQVNQCKSVYESVVGSNKNYNPVAKSPLTDEYGYHVDSFGVLRRNEKEWTGEDILDEAELSKRIFGVKSDDDNDDLPF